MGGAIGTVHDIVESSTGNFNCYISFENPAD